MLIYRIDEENNNDLKNLYHRSTNNGIVGVPPITFHLSRGSMIPNVVNIEDIREMLIIHVSRL